MRARQVLLLAGGSLEQEAAVVGGYHPVCVEVGRQLPPGGLTDFLQTALMSWAQSSVPQSGPPTHSSELCLE